MRRAAMMLVGLACPMVLLLACHGAVLLRDEQFAYRDASHFYDPLYRRVQQEWAAGRVPLWDPSLNGGTPILGYPMAAVLYPGKLIYALLPYAWAARLYVVAHTALALVGAFALGRSLGVGRAGSLLGGLAYAFGAPVLFQYCNVIYLVGAAWVPWGLRALDRLLRRGMRLGGCELSAVLALQVLGGDPEAAYLTALCGAGYAAVLATGTQGRPRPWLRRPGVLGATVAWPAAVLGLALARPGPGWFATVRVLVLVSWVIVGVVIVRLWRRRPAGSPLGPMLARLVASCAVAAALSGAQILPSLEFDAGRTRVAEDAALNMMYRFSLEPYRLVELAWPNAFGTRAPENRSWLAAMPPAGDRQPWVESLYMGAPALVLALGAFGWRGGPPWRTWLTAIVAVSLVLGLGKFAGPLWWARWLPVDALGPHDPLGGLPRSDGLPVDGTGSPYGLLATVLPGFGVFRYPGKLLTFAAMALAVLAGAGWDLVASGDGARVRRLGRVGLVASLLGLAASVAARDRAVALLTGRVPADALFGPADVAAAWAETQRALAHGAVAFAALLALARWAPRRPRLMGTLALVVVTADLAAANARLVWTAPQAVFEGPAEAARRIEEAERADPSPGPFRVHRMPAWAPPRFLLERSPRRLGELVAWERGTLKPLYALPLGLEYGGETFGYLELDDYDLFFFSQTTPAPAAMAGMLGIPPGHPLLYRPRRSYDLWGARYFLLPVRPEGWTSHERGFASFLAETDLIYPGPAVLGEVKGPQGRDSWGARQDWQLRRNRAAFPRAWLVHSARVRPLATDEGDRIDLLKDMLHMNDPIWSDPGRPVYNLRAMAWVEADDPDRLKGYVDGGPIEPSESVTVVEHEPQRVELKAVLRRPGLVILADTFYPGWRLTIDGAPAPILRANRLMRGAAVPAGEHTLVYTYEPGSFRLGAIASAVGLMALAAQVVASRRDRLAGRPPGG
jgi:hypothetical protein